MDFFECQKVVTFFSDSQTKITQLVLADFLTPKSWNIFRLKSPCTEDAGRRALHYFWLTQLSHLDDNIPSINFRQVQIENLINSVYFSFYLPVRYTRWYKTPEIFVDISNIMTATSEVQVRNVYKNSREKELRNFVMIQVHRLRSTVVPLPTKSKYESYLTFNIRHFTFFSLRFTLKWSNVLILPILKQDRDWITESSKYFQRRPFTLT